MYSALSLVALLLIWLIVLIIFVPAWLERRAHRNRQLRDEYSAKSAAMRSDLQRLKHSSAPYSRAHAPVYRRQLAVALERIGELETRLAQLNDDVARLKCPELFNYLLPIKHFILFPRDVGAIISDIRLLSTIRADALVAAGSQAAAETAVGQLAGIPARLAADRQACITRLNQIEKTIREERAAGVIALVDLDDDLARMRDLLNEQAAVPAGAPLRELDAGALILETATSGIAELETKVDRLHRERTRLDQRLRQAAAELDDAQAGTKAGPEAADAPPQIGPLLRRAAALLNESAAEHRRRRDFAAAGRDIDLAGRLIAIGRDLAVADRQARLLAARDDGQSLAAPIEALRREIDDALAAVAALPPDGAVDPALVDRASAVRRRSESLIRRQDEIIAALEREALAIRERIETAWGESSRILALDAEDPLVRRYNRLAAEYEPARRSPASLEEFRREASAFERTLTPWLDRLAANRERIARLRSTLPETIDEALRVAQGWHCLDEHITFIQQRAADFETARGHFRQVTRRRDAERLIAEIEAIERDVAGRMAILKDQAARLRFLEADVDQIIVMATQDGSGLPAESPEGARRDRTLQLIAHHTAQAHAAVRYEDASLALSRAADLANKLAL